MRAEQAVGSGSGQKKTLSIDFHWHYIYTDGARGGSRSKINK